MANIVGNPLHRFRKHDSFRSLHARWGDVAISAPTEGSWCQYDNPHHQSTHRRRGYGSGYIPEGRPRVLHSKHEDYDEEQSNPSSSRRRSSAISAFDPRRLSMRSSRPKPMDGGRQRQRQRGVDSGVDFAYTPVRHDYSTEVADVSNNRASRFRYIPASPRYPEELETIDRRSQSVSPYGFRKQLGTSALRYEDMGSSAEKKKICSARRMTTVMVPDAEDIYS